MKVVAAMLDRASKMPPSLKKIKMLKDAQKLIEVEIVKALAELKNVK
jgi:hypothetical protein